MVLQHHRRLSASILRRGESASWSAELQSRARSTPDGVLDSGCIQAFARHTSCDAHGSTNSLSWFAFGAGGKQVSDGRTRGMSWPLAPQWCGAVNYTMVVGCCVAGGIVARAYEAHLQLSKPFAQLKSKPKAGEVGACPDNFSAAIFVWRVLGDGWRLDVDKIASEGSSRRLLPPSLAPEICKQVWKLLG